MSDPAGYLINLAKSIFTGKPFERPGNLYDRDPNMIGLSKTNGISSHWEIPSLANNAEYFEAFKKDIEYAARNNTMRPAQVASILKKILEYKDGSQKMLALKKQVIKLADALQRDPLNYGTMWSENILLNSIIKRYKNIV